MSNQLKIFDYESSLKSLGGNKDIVHDMIQILVDELPEQRSQLDELAVQKDWKSLERLRLE